MIVLLSEACGIVKTNLPSGGDLDRDKRLNYMGRSPDGDVLARERRRYGLVV